MTVTRYDFDDLKQWVGARTGLTFTTDRCSSIEQVIQSAMVRTGFDADVLGYRRLLETDDAALDDLLAELTVGETYFFREPSQFQFIRHTVLPEIRQRRGHHHILRAWSAGCASGEEAYSLAIVLLEEGLAGRCHLLATDLSRASLEKARRGIFGEWSLRGEGALAARPYLQGRGNRFVLDEVVRQLVTFDHLNLAFDSDSDPECTIDVREMDLILCRNVLIYLDRKTVRDVARRLYDQLAAGGWLITASTDPPLADEARFEVELTDQGVFYRRGASSASWPIGPESARPEIACANAAAAEWENAGTEADEPADLAGSDGSRVGAGAPAIDAGQADTVLRIRALASQDVAEAERVCAEATQRHPLSCELHYLWAVFLLDLGREGEAMQAVRRAIYLDRSLAIAHFTLATLLQNRGEMEGAWRAHRNARDLCRTRPAEELVPLSDGEPAGRLLAAAETQMALIESARRSDPMSSFRRRTGPITDRRTLGERLARALTLIGEEPRPTPEQVRAVLEQRARALACVPVQPPPTSLVLDVVTFSLANESYALELGYVHKIVPLIELTPVPGAPDFFVGVVNLRGEIVPVIDLHRLYGMARTGCTGRSWVIVLGSERIEFALLADQVHEVITLCTDQVLDWQGSAAAGGRQFVRGVTESGLIILEGAALLQDDRLFIDQGDGAGV